MITNNNRYLVYIHYHHQLINQLIYGPYSYLPIDWPTNITTSYYPSELVVSTRPPASQREYMFDITHPGHIHIQCI